MSFIKGVFWTGAKFFPYFAFFYIVFSGVPFIVTNLGKITDFVRSKTGGAPAK